jgi:hypothetical protein
MNETIDVSTSKETISRKEEMGKKRKNLKKEKQNKSRNEIYQIIYSPLFYM